MQKAIYRYTYIFMQTKHFKKKEKCQQNSYINFDEEKYRYYFGINIFVNSKRDAELRQNLLTPKKKYRFTV